RLLWARCNGDCEPHLLGQPATASCCSCDSCFSSPRSRGGPSRLLFGNLLIGIAAVRTTASPLFQSRSLGPSSGTGLKAPLHCRPTSHHHDGYEHTFRHTRFAAPPMPLVHCSFNPLKAGRWLGMTKERDYSPITLRAGL